VLSFFLPSDFTFVPRLCVSCLPSTDNKKANHAMQLTQHSVMVSCSNSSHWPFGEVLEVPGKDEVRFRTRLGPVTGVIRPLWQNINLHLTAFAPIKFLAKWRRQYSSIPVRIYTMASDKAVTPIYVHKTAFKTKMDTKKSPYPINPGLMVLIPSPQKDCRVNQSLS